MYLHIQLMDTGKSNERTLSYYSQWIFRYVSAMQNKNGKTEDFFFIVFFPQIVYR